MNHLLSHRECYGTDLARPSSSVLSSPPSPPYPPSHHPRPCSASRTWRPHLPPAFLRLDHLRSIHGASVTVHYLDINHLPEPSEVHGGGLLLPLAELTVIHQARKLKKTFKSQGLTAVRLDLMESLGHNESALTYRRAN